jgi:pimeloyl-ACP methyl ester carboxylesterase
MSGYFGTAPWPDDGSKYSQQTAADDIAAFIRGLNAGPVDLVGWSYSGPIVMLVVLQHPELVRSLAVHEPGALSYVTAPAKLKIASEDRAAALGPAIAAARVGDFAGAARLTPIGVNHQPDFWETTTPETCSSTMRALGSQLWRHPRNLRSHARCFIRSRYRY